MADSMPTRPLPPALSSPLAPLLAPPSPALTDAAFDDEVDSLPSTSDSDEYGDDDEEEEARGGRHGDGDEADGDREWRESLQQLELLLTLVVAPYVGKYFGRRCAYWGWARFMEWKYPNIDVVITSPRTFRAAGLLEAASPL
ncbi:hypothetical protein B0A49_05372 [Cryomyces minteri]|uniref:Uncharacterized protein n=1 Tax=Cryomyces minteri TaxID=331657 RepID=A0A4U0X7R6_9PEZI|nr:hypothetical protein B0A49_05372 [Cryomyces minteri]